MSAAPDPDAAFARWLAVHPDAPLLAIAAFFARRNPGTRSGAAASDRPDGCPPSRRCVSELEGASL